MLPEQEYKKLYKLTRKYAARWQEAVEQGATIKALRILKKLDRLVGRAVELEDMWKLPKERRWTNAL